MQRKSVYVNDLPVGEASSWGEVNALLKLRGLGFIATPSAAEGPTGFFLYGTRSQRHTRRRPNGVADADEGNSL